MKRFLTVGINAYTGQELAGCVNDAHDWAEVLSDRGFVGTTLTDREATRANITAELREMVAVAGRGDTVVFQYSGHGTWVPDYDGDEADSRDEALVPFDYATAGLILDDNLYQIVSDNRAMGVRVLIISDSCHSGSVQRAMGSNVPPSLVDDRGVQRRAALSRFMPPVRVLPPESVEAATKVQHMPRAGTSRTGAALLAGCRDDQVAWDAYFNESGDGTARPNGAFTRAALDTLDRDRPSSLKAWDEGIHRRLLEYGYDQDPQVGGTWWQRNMARFV